MLSLFIIGGVIIAFLSHGRLGFFGREEMNGIIDVLLTVSSIIFAIVGAWVAIVFPSALRSFFNDNEANIEKEAEEKGLLRAEIASKYRKEAFERESYLTDLFTILVVSSLVLIGVIFIKVIFPLIYSLTISSSTLLGYLPLGKSILFSTLSMMTIVQIYSIFNVAKTNYKVLKKVRKLNQEQSSKIKFQ